MLDGDGVLHIKSGTWIERRDKHSSHHNERSYSMHLSSIGWKCA